MPCYLVLVFVACSLPDVALPPPRMVLFGALAQVLLVPPSGYRCFRRRPGCLASVRGVLWRIVSPLHCVSWQQRPLALCGDLSLYTMLHVLLGAVCSLTEVFIIV